MKNDEAVPESARRVRIGDWLHRREDARLVTGAGCYIDDIAMQGKVAHAICLRSPHAHAKIVSVDATEARKLPGVIAILLAEDVADIPPILDGQQRRSGMDIALIDRDGFTRYSSKHPIIVNERARFVGEIVAMVVAETIAAAKDGAEAVKVEYDVLPAVARSTRAIEADSQRLWDDSTGNTALDADVGDFPTTDAAFKTAAHVTRLKTWIQRVTGVHMEPRAAMADYDRASDQLTLYAANGMGPVRMRDDLVAMLGVAPEKIRVVHWDIGGSFGTRNATYPEFVLLCIAARQLGRPVKHVAERQEAFVSDYQGRDLYVEAELALDKNGKFVAFRSDNISNIGAYTASFTPLNKGVQLVTTNYDIATAAVRARGVMTNTPPTIPYRSAGRPEVIYVMERLIDLAAREHGFDRVELRRRNLIRSDNFPYRNPLGLTYDSGDYPAVMEKTLALSDWKGFKVRRAEARKRGKLRGIGIANYLEGATGMPRERSEIWVQADGTVEMTLGTFQSGQGHETAFPQLVSDWLGIPFDAIRYVAHDTNRIVAGGGSHSGRSMRIGSIAVREAVDAILAQGRALAAPMLGVADESVDFNGGLFTARGTNRTVHLFDVARSALNNELHGVGDHTVKVGAFPFGCHVCEVEVDPDTGSVAMVRYTAIDDVGKAINPMIVHGQSHGGIAQGVGQALWEQCVYEEGSGQMLSASFMDYALARASGLPSLTCELSEVPSTSNPMGIRPGGEGGCTPALGVTINAIVDALAEFGVSHVEMPATSERVWQAIQEGKRRKAAGKPA